MKWTSLALGHNRSSFMKEILINYSRVFSLRMNDKIIKYFWLVLAWFYNKYKRFFYNRLFSMLDWAIWKNESKSLTKYFKPTTGEERWKLCSGCRVSVFLLLLSINRWYFRISLSKVNDHEIDLWLSLKKKTRQTCFRFVPYGGL